MAPPVTAGDKIGKAGRRKTKRRQPAHLGSNSTLQKESRERNRELAELRTQLAEALEQQTATSEVLRIISSSPGKLEPIFQAVLQNAVRVCGAQYGNLALYDGRAMRMAAMHNAPPVFEELRRRDPMIPRDASVMWRVVDTKDVAQIADLTAEEPHASSALVQLAGARTAVGVPMLKNGDLVGGIVIYRTEPRPFTQKQIDLLTNFAAQAVIAIENARLLKELRGRTDDLSESLEQQTATAEILRVISSSAGELEPVFQTVLANATHLCDAAFGSMLLLEGEDFRRVAVHSPPPSFAEFHRQTPVVKPQQIHDLKLLVETKRPVHMLDAAAADTDSPIVKYAGARTLLIVPLLKDETLVGAVGIYRQEVRPFTNKQIELVENFAAHAVIAIENTRLLKELRESLEQQTATSDVLKVISSSPGSLEPVFDAMLENAVRICNAQFGVMHRCVGEEFAAVAMRNIPAALEKFLRERGIARSIPGTNMDQLIRSKQVIHTIDMLTEPSPSPPAKLAGARTELAVPMLKDGELVGAIIIYRQEVLAFTEKQIELLSNFAAQAVIAIENARLLKELHQRTDDLSEALEQQTATSEVLRVIAASSGDLEPVFGAMLRNATQICSAEFASLFRFENGTPQRLASLNVPPALTEFLRRGIPHVIEQNAFCRLLASGQHVHIDDYRADQAYLNGDPMAVAGVELGGIRSLLILPMIKDGEVIGAFGIFRQEVRPFSQKQIQLVSNFAAQAVIAIENARLLNELRDSLEQQTAASEVLKIISSSPNSSPGELEPVFRALLESATRLCQANFGTLNLYDRGDFPLAATFNVPKVYADYRLQHPIIRASEDHPLTRVAASREVLQIADMREEPLYLEKDASFIAMVDMAGARTLFVVPILKDDELLGVITIFRQEVRPFTAKQIEVVRNFAAQAVIAIENARLFEAEQQRTRELSESLEQQTATSEVLRVISSAPGDLEPVFNAMLQNSIRICEAKFGQMFLYETGRVRLVATIGVPTALVEFDERRGAFQPSPSGGLERLIRTKQVVHIPDVSSENASYPPARLGGARSYIAVPMIRDGELVGAIAIYRQEVRPFTDRQIALVTSFAAQAVIAIENARLLKELRQRTEDLSESLEQQTASSEVLSVISSSPGEIEPVFESMLQNAVRLCEADHGAIFRYAGDVFSPVAIRASPELADFLWRRGSFKPPKGTSLDRLMQTRDMVARLDEAAETYPSSPSRVGGARSLLAVPLLKDRQLIGAIVLYRKKVRAFTEKQIKLVSNFAAQAVIAIENSRLLNELRESLQQQTATADVLKVISRSTFDLQTVLDTLVQSAARLCEADSAAIHRPQGDAYPYVASFGLSGEYDDYMRKRPIVPGRGTVLGRAVTEGRPVQLPDVTADPEYTMTEGQKLGGFRTVLGVPLMREGTPIGVIVLTRNTVRPFSDKQIELASTFADQGAIAIENVRLFDEIQDKSRQLEEASKHKSQFLANMSHELRTPLNAILGYTELIVDGVYGETPERVQDALRRITTNGKHLLGLINDVLDLSKIEAGQLTLSLNDYAMKDIVYAVYGAVEALATEKKLKLKAEIAPDMPAGRGDERRITQVLLNLVGNAIKFTDDGEVVIKASAANGRFVVAVVDTGPGISQDDQKKLFQEFQQADSSTTKKKGGTGLGLAISKRIIEMHGGTVGLKSKVGEGSTFSFTLPVRAEQGARQT
jgi:GAF domain-containing protein